MRYHFYLLHGCTVVFLLTLVAVGLSPTLRGPGWDAQVNVDEAQRNERSTPRSFILPATPAVAEQQEQEARELKENLDVFRCLGNLRILGYGADDTPPALRARNLEAVVRFQIDHGLTPTARLDRRTVGMLKCEH